MSQIKNNIFISLALNISQVCDKIFVIKYQKEFHKEHSSAVRRYEGRFYRPQEKRERSLHMQNRTSYKLRHTAF